MRRRPTISKSTVIVGAVVAAVIAAGAGGLVVKRQADARAVQAAAADHERAVAEQAADDEAAQQKADDAERESRAAMIDEMQETITKDARKTVADGWLDGPIMYTTCTAQGGGSDDDLTAITSNFSCLAANKENDDGTVSGYGYTATMTWADGSYTWQLDN